jgi:uncharacterized protein (TIGR03067 family)
MRLFVSTVILLAAASLFGADDTPASKELKALAGEWKIVAIKDGDMELPKDRLPQIVFTIGADGATKAKLPEGESQSRITVDPSKTPKAMDIKHEDGIYKDKTQVAIYKLDGDSLTILATRPSDVAGERPADFSKGHQMIFERAKAK